MMFSPDRIPSLDKPEDGMGIHVVGVRESISKDDGLEGTDMSPTGFLVDQSGVKEEPAIIIQGGEEIPFLLGCGCPKMMRGVVLNQFSDIAGEHFSVMEGSFGFLQIEAVLFGSVNDGR